MSDVMKCPKCGGELEKGYVAAKLVAWTNEKISNWSLKGLWSGQLIINGGYPYNIQNVEAYRCTKCQLVIFEYEKREGS